MFHLNHILDINVAEMLIEYRCRKHSTVAVQMYKNLSVCVGWCLFVSLYLYVLLMGYFGLFVKIVFYYLGMLTFFSILGCYYTMLQGKVISRPTYSLPLRLR